MKTFKSIQEERGEKAYKQAISMGLKYGGFGYWKDPQTNETVYKTENDTLVPVEPREESELAAKGGPDAGGGRPDAMGGAGGMGQGMMGPAGMLQMPGGAGGAMPGQGILGAPEPGMEKVPKEQGWEPGPDGDTCVGPDAEPEADVPEDSFVGRTNFLKWKAGPDGDNMNTISLTMVKEQIAEADSTWGMETDYDFGERQPRSLGQIQQNAMAGPKKKDADVVKKMNADSRHLVKDPNYDLHQYNDEDYISQGVFGKTYKDRNGNIVKQGRIGADEMAALGKLKDNKAFPTLINGEFQTPFIHESSAYNNPMNRRSQARQGEREYWNPDRPPEDSMGEVAFHRKFPTAIGTYAMSPAKGSTLASTYAELDEEMQDKVMRNFWRARGDLHKAGFSHNDMHGDNIMVDPETGDVSIIDLGLAQENRLSALMEAFGGLDFEEGEDYQLAGQMKGAAFSDRMQEMAVANRENVEQELYDSVDPNMDMYGEDFHNVDEMIQEILRGDIHMREANYNRITDVLPALKDDEFVGKLINMLYNEIGNSELADRMSDAFTDRQKQSREVAMIDKLRANRGEKPLSLNNPKVIPPKNIIFDHDD